MSEEVNQPIQPQVTPERVMVEDENLSRHEFDAFIKMHAGLERRVDMHDDLIGRDGEHLKAIMRSAFSEALDDRAADPECWEHMRQAMVKRTAQAAGSWLLAGIATGLKALSWAALLALALYMVGGWKLLGSFVASVGAAHGQGHQ